MSSNVPILGTGWGFPPTFTEGGANVEMASGAEDVHQSLQILFATSLSERVMRDDYGCDLHSILFDHLDQELINSVTSRIKDAILYHEPRIDLDEIEVAASDTEPSLLLIQIEYTLRSTNSRFNMVYPFYLNEPKPDA